MRNIDNIPVLLNPSILMSEPNQSITVQSGSFTLEKDGIKLEADGEVYFTWAPYSGIKFRGQITKGANDFMAMNRIEKFDLKFNGLFFAQAYLNKTRINSDGSVFISGSVSGNAVNGDKSIPVERVKFSIANLRDLHGDKVRSDSWTGMNRLTFENDDYVIILDKRRDYKEIHEQLEEKGGYAILYYGEIAKKHGSILYGELNTLVHGFLTFLSFLNGRRCSPLFLQGTNGDEVIWTDYSGYFTDAYQFVNTWPPKVSTQGLRDLWMKFSRLWKDENDKDFLYTTVHWYVEANHNAGFAEGSIVMVQTALELIYNWLLIERKKLIRGKDAENISAANKIRLLLSDLGVSKDFPDSCRHLRKIGMEDAPEAFVQIRNAIIHSQEEKRKNLSRISGSAKAEALQVGIWYIELSLLKILEYQGQYMNRTSGFEWRKNAELPWAVKIKS